MSFFINDHFLLHSEFARELYHSYAKELPIIDYHSHLSPQAIAENSSFRNISHIWLEGDHYKWRAQRALGVSEHFITGDASDKEKFKKWAYTVPYTIRNPLYHWTHMELKNPFGVEELLSEKNADAIFDYTQSQLQQEEFSPRGLLNHFNVEMVGTTDDPVDTLEFHKRIAESDFACNILPSFRPDKAFALSKKAEFRTYINLLSEQSGITINSLDSLLDALQKRVNFFHERGCRVSDHGLSYIPQGKKSRSDIDRVFKEVLEGEDMNAIEYQADFTYLVLFELCKMYQDKGWVQQFHLGALRNNNSRKLEQLGPDTGYDSIGDYRQAEGLSTLLNALERENALAKTVIYNVNPSDNAVFASMIGNYQEEGIKGKIQFGSGWWFLDQLDGMTQQINTLSNTGLVSCFIGMLTDSRSFLSYSRHEYFRRLLCDLFAKDVEQGLLPKDTAWIGKVIQDICYYNAKTYFKQ
ncbi:MAG: glucuronate isomerase [Sphingobacterium sp.]